MFAPAAALSLQESQVHQLRSLARAGTTTQRVARRCRVILLAHEGTSNNAIAEQLGLSRPTVNATRAAFLRGGIEAIQKDPKRKRSRRVLNKELEQRILDTTLKTKPPEGTHWSVRGMAQRLGVSRMLVQRVWQRFDVQPHRVERFKLSNDPQFDEKVRDVVGLYLNPPDQALVLCVDEKSQIQALDRTRPILPLRPGLPERQTHDYKRYGTTTLFAALEVATGKVIGKCQRRHRSQEFLRFLEEVDEQLRTEQEIHLVMDNYGTHKTPKVKRWFARHPRYHLHFTPTSASWLNQVERFFAEITRRRIRRGTFNRVRELEQAIQDYLQHHNQNPKPFVWTATADAILSKIQRFCERTSET